MGILNDITDYIDFLRNCGYGISLSCFHNRFEPYTEKLLEYEIHTHSVCSFLKSNQNTLGRCFENKRKLEKVNFKDMYYSCCYAGVEEYVIPVMYNDKFIISINLSGYRGTLKKSKDRMNDIAKLCGNKFLECYNELSTEKPSESMVLSFITPLKYMLISLYKECRELQFNKDLSDSHKLYLEAMRYIHDNYMHNISSIDIAKHLNYSVSYLRYIFKKEGINSITRTVNELRLENARKMLLSTKMNVTDIAFHCGFCDANYFSTIFKNKYGVSPKKYKNSKFQ